MSPLMSAVCYLAEQHSKAPLWAHCPLWVQYYVCPLGGISHSGVMYPKSPLVGAMSFPAAVPKLTTGVANKHFWMQNPLCPLGNATSHFGCSIKLFLLSGVVWPFLVQYWSFKGRNLHFGWSIDIVQSRQSANVFPMDPVDTRGRNVSFFGCSITFRHSGELFIIVDKVPMMSTRGAIC